MAVSTRLGPIILLQDRVTAAANGSIIDITDASSAVVEILTGSTGMTVNFEASIDGGSVWNPVSLSELKTAPLTRASSTTNAGLYFLEFARPMNALRARVSTSGTPTGNITVRARAALA